mmetsp:Transcript_10075/g.19432  ORF Transcript_10075/g.19432 Transcript_10075/m.19432 type:complete len:273 (+) Transcript_10075:53-871(+)
MAELLHVDVDGQIVLPWGVDRVLLWGVDRAVVVSCKYDDVETEDRVNGAFARGYGIMGAVNTVLLPCMLAAETYAPVFAATTSVPLVTAGVAGAFLVGHFISVTWPGLSTTKYRANACRFFLHIRRIKPDGEQKARALQPGGVYYPNRYEKGHACQSLSAADPSYNPCCHPCTRDRLDSCNGERGICSWTWPDTVANPIEACWRTSFRDHLTSARNGPNGSVFVQVIDADDMGNLTLGDGQKEELGWARDAGFEIWHTLDGTIFLTGAWPGW